jgi:hypothetical protein
MSAQTRSSALYARPVTDEQGQTEVVVQAAEPVAAPGPLLDQGTPQTAPADQPPTGADSKPVFVDMSGRRGKLVRWVAYGVGAICLTYTALVGISLAGGPVSPDGLVPFPEFVERQAKKRVTVAPENQAQPPMQRTNAARTGGDAGEDLGVAPAPSGTAGPLAVPLPVKPGTPAPVKPPVPTLEVTNGPRPSASPTAVPPTTAPTTQPTGGPEPTTEPEPEPTTEPEPEPTTEPEPTPEPTTGGGSGAGSGGGTGAGSGGSGGGTGSAESGGSGSGGSESAGSSSGGADDGGVAAPPPPEPEPQPVPEPEPGPTETSTVESNSTVAQPVIPDGPAADGPATGSEGAGGVVS